MVVFTDATESAGDARPFKAGVADCALLNGLRTAAGGGIARDFCPGRCIFDMSVEVVAPKARLLTFMWVVDAGLDDRRKVCLLHTEK